MKTHTKNYMNFFGFKITEDCICEIPGCQSFAQDVHHIVPRSKFGTKTKHIQDDPVNLIGLCRLHHEQAHSGILSKDFLKIVHEKFIDELKCFKNNCAPPVAEQNV